MFNRHFFRYLLLLAITAAFSADIKAQTPAGPQNPYVFSGRNAVLLQFNFGRQYPLADMKDRFGSNPTVGFTVGYKTPSNWQFDAGINAIYGSTVKENTMFDSLTGPSGDMIDANGNLAVIRLYERGYYWHVSAGKIFRLSKKNENTGLMLSFGGGFMQHKIKFTYFKDIMPQLDGDMYKGYDRLSNGFMLRQWIGYQRLDPRLRFNFFAGVEMLEGFTKNRRELNYDTRMKDTRQRMDVMLGLKVGLIIPIYGKHGRADKIITEEKYFD